MQVKKQYREKLFTSFQLSGHVPGDNFYRRLKESLDLQWLYKTTRKYYGREGQQSFDPVVFFKLILVGHLENLNSDRKIIEHSKLRLDILFFLGYDLDEELPWHSTISKTRALYGEEVFKELFSKVLSLCVSKGMLSGRRQAIDSAYIKANASMDSLIEKQIIEDGEHYLEQLQHDDYGKEIEQHGSVMKDDRDSDIITRSRNKSTRQLNYSMQTAVDMSSYIITNVEAHLADRRDSECLSQVLQNTISNLKQQSSQVEEIAADTGYSSTKALKVCIDQGITAYIPNFGQYKPTREGFEFDEVRHRYTCVAKGVHLAYKKTYQDKKGYYKKQYCSSAKIMANVHLEQAALEEGLIIKR